MPSNPELRISGNSEDAIRAIAALERKYDNLENKIKRAEDASKKSSKSAKDGIESQVSVLGSLIGKYVSLAAVLSLANKEYETMRQRGKDALNTQLQNMPSTEMLAFNVGRAPGFEPEVMEAIADRISVDKGVAGGRASVRNALGSAMSARGHLSPQEAVAAVEATMELVPFSTDAQRPVSGGILDIRKRRPDITEEQAIGYMSVWQEQSRVESLESFAQNVLPGITSMAAYDKNRLEETAAIHGAITEASIDTQGRRSSTAGIALMVQARQFWGREHTKDMSNAEVLGLFHEDEEARKVFLSQNEGKTKSGRKWGGIQSTVTDDNGNTFTITNKGASFEKRSLTAIEELLTPGTKGFETYQHYLKEQVTPKMGQDVFAQKNKELDALPHAITAKAEQQLMNQTESLKLGNVKDAGWATTYETVGEKAGAAGLGWLSQFMISREVDIRKLMGYSPQEARVDVLQVEQGRMLKSAADNPGNAEVAKKLGLLLDVAKEQLAESKSRKLNPNGQVE